MMNPQWNALLQQLQQTLTPELYATWVQQLRFDSFDNNLLAIGVPGQVFADVMVKEIRQPLTDAIYEHFGQEAKVRWVLPKDENPNARAGIAAVGKGTPYTPQRQSAPAPLKSYLNPDYTFENFCEGMSNRVALAMGKSIVDHPEQQLFNPFFLYGPSGVGKTHLVNAIGLALAERHPDWRILFVSARQFQTQYTDARNNTNDFIYFYQSIHVLIIDDFQEITGEKTQNAFFHIFNHLQANKRKILITCDRAPAEFKGIEERMLTRLKWGGITELERPDLRLRRDILEAKLRRENIVFSEEVTQYIAENVSDSVREIQGTVNSLIAFSLRDFCAIDLDLARRVVARVVNQAQKVLTLDDIVAAICNTYKVKPSEIAAKSRKSKHVQARHLTMYLTNKYTTLSLSQIGRELGGRDHSTVSHACTQIELRLNKDQLFHREVEEVEASLKKK